MAILENGDYDFSQLWSLIQELGEQLSQNRSQSVSLYGLAGSIKNQALHSQTGFVLRRFNLDKSKEEYDAELERMNAALSVDNQALQHDNKQLSGLIKEYEQTLETLMSTFRNRAQDVQERELALIREYESKLLAREEEISAQDLSQSTRVSSALGRLSHLLRLLLRAEGGEDVDIPVGNDNGDREAAAVAEEALEREIELARLEKENEELRRMMGLIPSPTRRASSEARGGFGEGNRMAMTMSPDRSNGNGHSFSGGSFGAAPANQRMRPPG